MPVPVMNTIDQKSTYSNYGGPQLRHEISMANARTSTVPLPQTSMEKLNQSVGNQSTSNLSVTHNNSVCNRSISNHSSSTNKLSDQSKQNMNNNSENCNNNNNKCNNNNNNNIANIHSNNSHSVTSHSIPHHITTPKHSIKTENNIKVEKSVCRSPTPQSHFKVDAFVSHSSTVQIKTIDIDRTAAPSSINDHHDVPQQLPQNHLLSMHSSTMPSYLPIDSGPPPSQSLNQPPRNSVFDPPAHHPMLTNHHISSMDEQYLREQHQLRYSQQIGEMSTIARPTVSYPSELVSSRVSYELATRSYDPSGTSTAPSSSSTVMTTSGPFERYDPNCLPQRSNMYSYLQPNLDDINIQQQKYLQEQQHMAHAAMMKAEHDENTGPIYPRPMYHYDPGAGPLPPGFSAINLSVKINAAQQAAAAAFHKSNGTVVSPGAPVIDLSTSSVTSSSPPNFNSTHYNSQRLAAGSPGPGSSPRLASPQEPSPQGQTLDLSVSRLSHNR